MYRTTIALFFALGALTSIAQSPMVGVKGGLNVSTLGVDEANDENARIGFNAGVFGRTDPDRPVGLQVELLYSTRGTHTTYSGFFGLVDQDVDFKLDYLELPVLASFRLGESFELQAGGYAGYLLSANVATSGDLGNGDQDINTDNFKRMDFGVVGGVAFNTNGFQFGLRYLHGLSEVADSDASDLVIGNAMNRCFQAYLAFGLNRTR